MPLNSRSLGKVVIDFYLGEAISSVYLVVNQADFNFALEEFGCFGDAVAILSVVDSESVVDTLEQVLPKVSEQDVIINIVTTIPKIIIPEKNCIGLNEEVTGIEGWAGVLLNGDEMSFITKKDNKDGQGYSFSGIFRADKTDILKAATSLRGEDRRDLISVVSKIHEHKKMTKVHFSWSDCGHVQNYYKTRQRIIGSRFFNSISLDPSKGVLTKTSSNVAKLSLETRYVQTLPVELSVYFPRIFEFKEDDQTAKVTMEYYAYPTLAEIMLYWDLPKSVWKDIFFILGKTLSSFERFKGDFHKLDWQEIYVQKVKTRVATYLDSLDDDLKQALLSGDHISINGENQVGWKQLSNHLDEVLSLLERSSDCTIVHGDFCCNNILCEPYSGLIKLIDARGSFGDAHIGIYGDRKYDWAKLGHSIFGKYDYIVNDLFTVDCENLKFELHTFDRPWQLDLEEMYWAELDKAQIDRGVIQFIVGTLFISMPPLHSDNTDRQLAFFLRGIEFLNAGLKKMEKLQS